MARAQQFVSKGRAGTAFVGQCWGEGRERETHSRLLLSEGAPLSRREGARSQGDALVTRDQQRPYRPDPRKPGSHTLAEPEASVA